MGPRCVPNDKPVLRLGDGAGEVTMFLPLLIVVHFCNHEYSAKLIFESVDGLWGDHAVEACQFVAKRNQHVVGLIAFEGCHFCTLLVPLLLECYDCEKAC